MDIDRINPEEVRDKAHANNLLYALYRARQIIKFDGEANLLTDAIKNYVIGK